MQPRNTQAIMLRRTNYGEADRIINFLTPHLGKVSAIAKGVRRPKSKLAGGLELFAVSNVTIMQGRGELALITSARLDTFFGNLLHDYDRMQLGYDMLRIMNRATETVGEPDFYDLLRGGFDYANDLKIDPPLTEAWFRLQLAALLGGGVNLLTDASSVKLQQDQRYSYNNVEHAFYANAKGAFGAEHIKLLRLASAKNPRILARISGAAKVVDELLPLLRGFE